jgi:hypothetical protein
MNSPHKPVGDVGLFRSLAYKKYDAKFQHEILGKPKETFRDTNFNKVIEGTRRCRIIFF